MRIVCDNCGAKYQISDDKVRNKVFKIRCKKCQHVIVVRAGQKEPSAEAEPQQPPAQEEEETRIAGVPQGMQQQQPSEAIWYVVINRNQVGPMSKAEIKGHLDAGKIDGDTFAWAEGVTADWAKLSGIPQLSDLLAAPSQPEPAFQPAPSQPEPAFQPAPSQPEPAPQAAVFSSAPAEPSGDVFMPDHGAAPAAREPDKKFRAAAPMDEPQDPRVSSSQQLRGQRNENSVLFSLDALGGGDDDFGAAKPKSAGAMEGSGLLDIAALGGGGGGGGDLFGGSDGGDPFGGGDHFAPVMGTVGAMPALVTRPRGPSPLVWALGALGGLGVIAGAIFGTLYVMKKEEPITPAPMAQPAPVAAPVAPIPAALPAPVPAAPTPAAPITEPPAAPTPAVEPPSAAPTVSKKRGGRRRSSGQSKTTSQDDGEDEPPAAAAPKPSKPKAQPAKSSGGDTSDVDDLLGALDGKKSSGGGGGGRTQPAEPAADPMLPEQLSKNQILRVVKGGAGKVKACRTEGEGMVTVKMTIEKKGNVSTADAQGANAGSALGRCVESKVRAFRFPQFSGSPMTINMPFKI